MRYELRCRECNKSWGNIAKSICEDCFSPLEVFYDYDAIRKSEDFTRDKIAQGAPNMWRYSALLPLPEGYQPTLPVGFTPLIKARSLATQIGTKNLFTKNDAVCLPTLSFKDRVVAVALANAQAFGYDTVACSSTGNLANAVAAHAARLGLKAWIFIPSDLEPARGRRSTSEKGFRRGHLKISKSAAPTHRNSEIPLEETLLLWAEQDMLSLPFPEPFAVLLY